MKVCRVDISWYENISILASFFSGEKKKCKNGNKEWGKMPLPPPSTCPGRNRGINPSCILPPEGPHSSLLGSHKFGDAEDLPTDLPVSWITKRVQRTNLVAEKWGGKQTWEADWIMSGIWPIGELYKALMRSGALCAWSGRGDVLSWKKNRMADSQNLAELVAPPPTFRGVRLEKNPDCFR